MDKSAREKAAILQLHDEWPDFPELSEYAGQYMERLSEEAKFVKAVDKLLPPIMIELSGATEWHRLSITLDAERENKQSLHVSRYLSPYYDLLIEWLDDKNNIPKR